MPTSRLTTHPLRRTNERSNASYSAQKTRKELPRVLQPVHAHANRYSSSSHTTNKMRTLQTRNYHVAAKYLPHHPRLLKTNPQGQNKNTTTTGSPTAPTQTKRRNGLPMEITIQTNTHNGYSHAKSLPWTITCSTIHLQKIRKELSIVQPYARIQTATLRVTPPTNGNSPQEKLSSGCKAPPPSSTTIENKS